MKIGIIGTGNISPAHISGYLELKNMCDIVALVDIYPEKAEQKKKTFGLKNAVVYDSHTKIFDLDLDLVSICTPPYTHADIAIDCMKAGINVIIEKPMASSLEECDKIIEAMNKYNKVASSVAQNRFRNPVMNLKKVMDQDFTGKILHAQVDSFWWRGHCYYDLWWRGTWEKEGGGCTLNHAVHHIDMVNWLMGMPKEVTSIMSNLAHDNAEIEDISISILNYGDSLAQITGSVIHHGEEQQVILQGERARISYPFKVSASTSRANGFPEESKTLEEEIRTYHDNIEQLQYEGHTAQILDVINSIVENRSPFITVEDGKNTIELITAMYKSASTKETVTLPILKEEPWYTVEGILKNATYFYEKKTHAIHLGDDIIKL